MMQAITLTYSCDITDSFAVKDCRTSRSEPKADIKAPVEERPGEGHIKPTRSS